MKRDFIAIILIITLSVLFVRLLIHIDAEEDLPKTIGTYICTEKYHIAGTEEYLPVVYWVDNSGGLKTTTFYGDKNLEIFISFLTGGEK